MSNPDDRLDAPEYRLNPDIQVQCPVCKDWWNNGEDSRSLCDGCVDNGWSHCIECNDPFLFSDDEDDEYCSDCCERLEVNA